jgi:hypothetical protein
MATVNFERFYKTISDEAERTEVLAELWNKTVEQSAVVEKVQEVNPDALTWWDGNQVYFSSANGFELDEFEAESEQLAEEFQTAIDGIEVTPVKVRCASCERVVSFQTAKNENWDFGEDVDAVTVADSETEAVAMCPNCL